MVEVTLGFLSTGGGDPDLPLGTYVRDALRMRDQAPQVLEVSWMLRPPLPRGTRLAGHLSSRLRRPWAGAGSDRRSPSGSFCRLTGRSCCCVSAG